MSQSDSQSLYNFILNYLDLFIRSMYKIMGSSNNELSTPPIPLALFNFSQCAIICNSTGQGSAL